MIRALALALLAAPMAQAQTYHGLTLGDPVPDTRAPVSVQPFADRVDADRLPAYMRSLCKHQMLPTGATSLHVATQDCDGPIVLVSAFHALSYFFDPDSTDTPLTPDIDGLTFHETTLAEVRAKFCSEGLIAPRWYGQKTPDNINAFALAYQIEGADAIAAFWFQLDTSTGFLNPQVTEDDPQMRDAAVLISVDMMSSAFFALQTEGPAEPSAGYRPIGNVFDPSAPVLTDCALS